MSLISINNNNNNNTSLSSPSNKLSDFNYSFVPELSTRLMTSQEKLVMRCYKAQQDHGSCILAENCGSGKTLIALVLLQIIKSPKKPFLVVAPISAIESWESDMKKHFNPTLSYIIIGPKAKQYSDINKNDPPIVIISYSMLAKCFSEAKKSREVIIIDEINHLRQNYPLTSNQSKMTDNQLYEYIEGRKKCEELELYLERYKKNQTSRSKDNPGILTPLPSYLEGKEVPRSTTILRQCLYYINWKAIIVDEAHIARNCSRSAFNSLVNLKSEAKLLITATPCNNSFKDLVSLLKIMKIGPNDGWSGIDKKSNFHYASFLNTICSKVFVASSMKERKKVEEMYKIKRIMVYTEFSSNEERVEYDKIYNNWKEGAHENNDLIKLRNISSNSSSSSTINNDNDNNDNMPLIVSVLSNSIPSVKQKISREKNTRISNILAVITKLRQKCDNQSKINAVCNYVEQRVYPSKEKAVIYTCFVKTAEKVTKELEKRFGREVYVFQITGTVKRDKRVNIINKFSSLRCCCILVATITTINLGVDLFTANHALAMNVWWNPVIESQAFGRLSRPQQTRSLFWVSFVTKRTVEESIWLVSQIKSELNNNMISGDISEGMLDVITSRSALKNTVRKGITPIVGQNTTTDFENTNADNLINNGGYNANNTDLLGPVVNCDTQKFLGRLARIRGIKTNQNNKKKEQDENEDEDEDILKPNQVLEIRSVMKEKHQLLLEDASNFKCIPKTEPIKLNYVPTKPIEAHILPNRNSRGQVMRKSTISQFFTKRHTLQNFDNFVTLRTKSTSDLNCNMHNDNSPPTLLLRKATGCDLRLTNRYSPLNRLHKNNRYKKNNLSNSSQSSLQKYLQKEKKRIPKKNSLLIINPRSPGNNNNGIPKNQKELNERKFSSKSLPSLINGKKTIQIISRVKKRPRQYNKVASTTTTTIISLNKKQKTVNNTNSTERDLENTLRLLDEI